MLEKTLLRLRSHLLRPEAILFCLIAITYVFMAASTVQFGDTGELVTNSYFLRVSHPPGYPLWTLIYHLPLRFLGSNPFYLASLVTIAISLVWIGLLIYSFRSKDQLTLIAIMASSLVVWRYSILPDVFALHILFLTLFFLAFLEPEKLTKPWVILLLALSITHHHTIIFVLPMFLATLLQHPDKKKFLYSITFGLSSLGMYGLLIFFHPHEYGSWSELNGLGDVWDHFLRKEYGTFRLQVRDEAGDSWILFFLRELGLNSWAAVIILGYIIARHSKKCELQAKKIFIIGFSLLAYLIVFSALGDINLNSEGQLIAERFLIQPVLLFFFVILLLLKSTNIKLPRWLLFLAIVNVATNVYRNHNLVNYSKNTSIEDYLLNAMNSLPSGSVYYTYGDTIGFGTYYLKDVKRIRPDLIHIHPTWGFDWGPKKFASRYPGLLKKYDTNLYKSMPFEKYRFFTNLNLPVLPQEMDYTHHGLLFELALKEKSLDKARRRCDQNYTWRKRPELEVFYKYDFSRVYELAYGDCHFQLGLEGLKLNDYAMARQAFEQSLRLSPYKIKAQERLCHTLKSMSDPSFKECDERLNLLLSLMDPQYL